MRNVILAVAVTALCFSGALNYAFLTGKFTYASPEEHGYAQADIDYVTRLASAKD